MSVPARLVLGLAFIVSVYGLAWWLMRIATRPPTGFWAVDPSSDLDEDPDRAAEPRADGIIE